MDRTASRTYSVYVHGSEPLTSDEDICLSAWSGWSGDSYGIKDTFTPDKDDDGVTPFCGKSFKRVGSNWGVLDTLKHPKSNTLRVLLLFKSRERYFCASSVPSFL